MKKLRAGDVSGAVADLGILVPLAAGLVLVNGLHPGPLLLGAGLLSLGAGLFFRIPFPVQPLKALTALALAQQLAPDVIYAAGLEIGVLFILLGVTGIADRLARYFTKPVIRSLQFAVGTLLVVTAVKLALEPPEVFQATFGNGWVVPLTVAVFGAIAVAAHFKWSPAGALILAAGIAAGWIVAAPSIGPIGFNFPDLALPPASVFGTAFVLLVIPQVPLTYGNAVVGVSDLAREVFGDQARRVTPRAVALSCGAGNVVAALIGGMPMCHGSSGLSGHVRLGARSHVMNVLLGGTLIAIGIFYSDYVIALFGVLPVWALAGFLAYAGVRHALLILDLKGLPLGIAAAAGLLGVVTGNLAYTTAIALVVAHGSGAIRSPGRTTRSPSAITSRDV